MGNKFKKGDRVEALKSRSYHDYYDIKKGLKGVVLQDDNMPYILFDEAVRTKESSSYTDCASHFNLSSIYEDRIMPIYEDDLALVEPIIVEKGGGCSMSEESDLRYFTNKKMDLLSEKNRMENSDTSRDEKIASLKKEIEVLESQKKADLTLVNLKIKEVETALDKLVVKQE